MSNTEGGPQGQSQTHENEKGSMQNFVNDLEGRSSLAGEQSHERQSPLLDLNHYQIVDDVWHFSSVDMGSNCEDFHPVL